MRPALDGRPSDGGETQIALWLQRGDRRAAPALWDHFAPLVRGLLVRAFGPEEDIDDSMQEVFLRVFSKGSKLRDAAKLRSYVVAVTVHFIRSEFRRRRTRRFLTLDRGEQPPADAGAGNPGGVLAVHALYRALDALPADERLAFTLRFAEGAELTEAAALARTSVTTFKRRLAAAMKRLWALTGKDPSLAPYLTRGDLQLVRGDEP